MPRKGYQAITVKNSTYKKILEIANILEKSVPETLLILAEQYKGDNPIA